MCKGSILGTHEYMSGMAACWHRWEAANGNPALADLYIDTMDALDAINDNAIYFIEVSAPELHGILRSHCGLRCAHCVCLRYMCLAESYCTWPTWRRRQMWSHPNRVHCICQQRCDEVGVMVK